MVKGDPEGRRIARRRAALIAEARALVQLLDALLQRANVELDDPGRIAEQLTRLEAIELQRAHGHVESRRRFKSPPHRVLWLRPRNHLYIDESGKSFPEPKAANDPGVFVLAGVALAEEEVDNYKVRADEIKLRFFKDKSVTFHEPQMRDRRGKFKFRDKEEADAFDVEVDKLVESTPFVTFGIAIRKAGFDDFAALGADPYMPSDVYSLAIMMLLERYVDFLAQNEQERLGKIFFERQGKKEDAFHQLEYARHLCEGSQWIAEGVFQDWVEPGLTFLPKAGSDPTELADMFSRDLFEWVRDGCQTTPKRWHLFNSKTYLRGDGLMGKFGVKVFPDMDIRDRIMEHRRACGVE